MPDEKRTVPAWELGEGKSRPKKRSGYFDEFSQLPPEEIPSVTVKSIFNDAKKQKCWIRKNNSWYTPEEFLKLYERHVKPDLSKFEIKDPIERVNDGFKYIADFKELDKMEAFNKFVIKVIEYYRG